MRDEIRKRIETVRRGEVPEGYVVENHQLHPLDWKYEKIGKYLVAHDEYSNDTGRYMLATSSRQGLLPQTDYYNDQRFDETAGGFHVVPEGYVTYRHMSDDDVFKFNVNDLGAPVLVSPEYPVFTTKAELNQSLLIGYLNGTNEFRSFCRAQKKGSTRTRMYFSRLGEFMMPIPPILEQQKIADILAACDRVIDLKKKRVEELKQLKKTCLAKMFPREGEDVPELRFPGFTAPWEQRKLGELARIKDSARISNALWTDTGIPYLRASDLSNNDLSGVLFLEDETFQYFKNQTGAPSCGDVLFNGGGEIGEAVLKRDNKPIYVQGGAVLYAQTSLSEVLKGEYLATYFKTDSAQKYIEIASAGGTMKHFTLGPAQNMPITYPSSTEQNLVGQFFHSIDNLITLHQRELEAEQQKKKALMQLLLTGLVRV